MQYSELCKLYSYKHFNITCSVMYLKASHTIVAIYTNRLFWSANQIQLCILLIFLLFPCPYSFSLHNRKHNRKHATWCRHETDEVRTRRKKVSSQRNHYKWLYVGKRNKDHAITYTMHYSGTSLMIRAICYMTTIVYI